VYKGRPRGTSIRRGLFFRSRLDFFAGRTSGSQILPRTTPSPQERTTSRARPGERVTRAPGCHDRLLGEDLEADTRRIWDRVIESAQSRPSTDRVMGRDVRGLATRGRSRAASLSLPGHERKTINFNNNQEKKMATKACRDCGEAIEWEQNGGKWIPLDPASHERHQCKIDQRCETCQKIFQGANWMTTCPSCYRSGRNASQPAPEAPRPSHTPEPLREGLDDDAPPF